MGNVRWILIAASLAAFLTATQQQAFAQDGAATVKKRQELMDSLYLKYIKGWADVARGNSTDISAIPAQAKEAAAVMRTIPSLFPAGTGHDAVPSSRAKPEVWTKRADFEAAVAALATETEKFGTIAQGGNVDAVKAEFASLGKACGACHGGPKKAGGPFRFEEQ